MYYRNFNFFLIFKIVCLVSSVASVGFQGIHFGGIVEPRWTGPRKLVLQALTQKLDHFNHRDNRTWSMRYYAEDKYFNGNGPVFLMLGGEWSITPGFLQSGLMHDLAKLHKGLMFYVEHRYYGKSRPTNDLSTENMQYLSIDQALADFAYFINYIQMSRNITSSNPVIVHGGSYAGNMAAWMKLKYPHLIKGAIASSAPVYAKADFHEYYNNVAETLNKESPLCAKSIKDAFHEARGYLKTLKGRLYLKKLFNLCRTVDINNENDISFFLMFLTEGLAGNVQYNKAKSDGTSSVQKTCKFMTDNKKYRTPLMRLSRFYASLEGCTVDYKNFVLGLQKLTWSKNSRNKIFCISLVIT